MLSSCISSPVRMSEAILESGRRQQPTGGWGCGCECWASCHATAEPEQLSLPVHQTNPIQLGAAREEIPGCWAAGEDKTLLVWPGCITCTENQRTGIGWKIQQERIKGDAEHRRIWINDIFQPSLVMATTSHCARYSEKNFSMRPPHFRGFLWKKLTCLLTPSFEMSQNHSGFWVRRGWQRSSPTLKGMAHTEIEHAMLVLLALFCNQLSQCIIWSLSGFRS